LKFNQRKKKTQIKKTKDLYLKGFLLVESLNLMAGMQLMEEILPLLRKFRKNKKAERIQTFLAQHS